MCWQADIDFIVARSFTRGIMVRLVQSYPGNGCAAPSAVPVRFLWHGVEHRQSLALLGKTWGLYESLQVLHVGLEHAGSYSYRL